MNGPIIFRWLICCILFHASCAALALDEKAVRTITIRAVPGMRFDPVRIKAEPGEKIKVVFANADDMSHNFLIVKPGSRLHVVEEALKLAERGPEKNYIPDVPDILWSLPVVSPGEIGALNITVPQQEGAYPYVCTFPGHGFVMYGALYVTRNELLPIQDDPNVPEYARVSSGPASKHTHSQTVFHPYPLSPPVLYRVFMPNAGPASFAVRITDSLSYCWDSSHGRLLYAWKGGFIDNSVAWRGHVNAEAEILGEIFYQAAETCPLSALGGKSAPVIFKGYTLKKGYPEFHYTIGSLDVYETILPGKNRMEWVHQFRVSGARKGICFDTSGKGKYTVRHSAGRMKDRVISLSNSEALRFSVTYTF
ncbi:hypothetical protein DYBT9275_05659 [Dyadobacter sp. CECT 9275]|uniref:Blue (type 1) copper domain-containing protein n=2 Tax=Dyadobacter helix TaxID=2822344 RepID=A0A916N8K4_9BACT|nr:hypothetical protein DYBT9275_05659 [Dyadobacter sp. CECT 9275]